MRRNVTDLIFEMGGTFRGRHWITFYTDHGYTLFNQALEGWRAEKVGEERRASALGAGAGGIVGGVVAVIVRVIGGR